MKREKIRKRVLASILATAMVMGSFSGMSINAHAAGEVLWVDAEAGLDTNDGSSASSAFKTIQAAKKVAAEKSADSDVTVYIKKGVYQVTEAIRFGTEDSGKNGHTITYKAAEGEKPVISGGTEVTGWTLHDSENNIWKASISEKAAESRQFYVDGEHETRAMTEVSPTSWEIMGNGGYISPYVESQTTNEYVILDLGEEKTVSYITLYPNTEKDKDGRYAGFPQDFTIETSVDGTNYETQYTATDTQAPGSKKGMTYSFSAVKARYIKLNVTKLGTAEALRPGEYALSLSEIEAGVKSEADTNQNVDLTDNILKSADQVEFVGYYSNDGARTDSIHVGTPKANLVDQNKGTITSTGAFIASWLSGNNGSLSPAFVLDVSENGEAVPVSAIELNSRVEGGKAINYAKDFKVQVTVKDNPAESDWETVSEQTKFDWSEKSRALFLFRERDAKKIRIIVSDLGGSEDGTNYMLQFTEIAVYHDKVEAKSISVEQEASAVSETASAYGENLLKEESQIILLGHCQNGSATSNIHGALPIGNLIDGDKGTFASTGGYQTGWFPGTRIPTLTIDVSKDGKAVPVSLVKLTARALNLSLPKDFTIQVTDKTSPSEDDWKTVVTKSDYTWNNSVDAEFTFDAVKAAQIRVQVTAFHEDTADSGHYYLQFAEMEVYGPEFMEENILTGESQIKFFGHLENEQEKSYANSSYPLPNLFDGDKATVISTQGYRDGWLASGGGSLRPCLILDLSRSENPSKVSSIEVTSDKTLGSVAKAFKIQISKVEDPIESEWITVGEETDYDWSAAPTYTVKLSEQTDVYQIRMEAITLDGKINDTDYQWRIAEMAVYGILAKEAEAEKPWVDPTLPEDATIVYCSKTAEDAEYTIKKISVKNENSNATYNSKKLLDGHLYTSITHAGYSIPEEDAISLQRPEDLEINVLRWWYHRILKVRGTSADGTEVYFDDSVLSLVQDDSFADNISWLENAYEFIDTVGEWYINKDEKVIYYKADGNMSGKTAVLPVTEQLIVFDGCSNVTFDGFEFAYTTWTRPSAEGHIDAQSGTYHTQSGSWGDIPGGIQIGNGSNIKVTNSRIHNFGTGGVRIMNHTSDCEVSNCAIYDISSVGVWVGNNYGHGTSCGEDTLVKNNTVKNNYITRVGLDIYDSAGITVLYTNGTVVDHNEVCNTPYTGISVGWGWDWNPSACAGNNVVSNNFIHDTGLTTHDGGSIYTLGIQNGTKLSGNYVYSHGDPKNDKDIALYLDEGSEGLEVCNNVVGDNVYWWGSMWTSSIKNNNWHDNYYQVNNFRDKGTNNTVKNNTYVADGDFTKYEAAKKIIDQAGLTDSSVKQGLTSGASDKHQVSLTKYENCEAYYFSQEDGLTSFEIEGQIGNTQYSRRTRSIEILMPENTDVTNLKANLVCKNGYQLAGGTSLPTDYSETVTFKLQNGSDVVTWTVKVKVNVNAEGELSGTETKLDDIIKDTGNWSVPPTKNDDGSINFKAGSFSYYTAKRFKSDEILEFDMKMNLNTESKDWAGFAFRVQTPTQATGTMYHICINNDSIEVQKWVGGVRTMLYGTIEGFDPVYGDLANDYFTANERHSIKTGAVDVAQGVRLFMYVDGNKVFDVIDADSPISGTGFFTVYPMTQAITLYEFSNIEKNQVDLSALKAEIQEAEKVDKTKYTEDSLKAFEKALSDAKALAEDKDATQTAVNAAQKALKEAKASLKEKTTVQEGLHITEPTGTVDLYSQKVKDYLNKADSETVYDFYKAGVDGTGDASFAPVTITWTDSDDSQITKYVVEYATKADYSDAVQVTKTTDLSDKKIEVYNLYKAMTYYVRVTSYKGDTAVRKAESTFKTTEQGPRIMNIDSLYNVRDLGGYLTADGKRTLQGMIYRGCEMNGSHGLALSEAGNAYMSNVLGIKLDLDLRADDSKTPLSSATKKSFPINGYEYAFTEKEYYRQIFAELADESNYPVYIHCWGGADRTGTVSYLLNALLGVSEKELIQDYELTSWSIFGVRDVDSATYHFSEFVTRLKGYEGGTLAEKTENYMLSIGVTKEEIASIRAIMIEGETDTKALEEAIENAEKIDQTGYTEESVKRLKNALSDAKALLKNEAATQKEIDNAVTLLTNAVKNLIKKTENDPPEDKPAGNGEDNPPEFYPVENKPSGNNGGGSTGAAGTSTGDMADMMEPVMLLMISAVAVICIVLKKRRKTM